MAGKGARHLVFLSRSSTSTNQAAIETVSTLKNLGVNVVVLRTDVAKRDELEHAVDEARSGKFPLPPICGVPNAAGILHDGLFNNVTATMWHEVADPKVLESLNLHHAFSP